MENQTAQKWYQKPVIVILFLIFFFPVGLYLMWKYDLWSKTTKVVVSAFFGLLVLGNISKNSSSSEDCIGNVRAYEFGQEMATFSIMSNNLSLSESIQAYSDGIGVNPPYDSDNACVRAGFNDGKNNVESPYNKEGKNWTSF